MGNPLRLSPAETLLRLAVAFSFIYPAVSALSDPYSWVGYFPSFLLASVGTSSLVLLHAFGVIEVLLALWVLFGKRIFVPSVIAAVMLLAIIAFNLAQFPILFRDVSIALACLALAWKHRPSRLHGTS